MVAKSTTSRSTYVCLDPNSNVNPWTHDRSVLLQRDPLYVWIGSCPKIRHSVQQKNSFKQLQTFIIAQVIVVRTKWENWAMSSLRKHTFRAIKRRFYEKHTYTVSIVSRVGQIDKGFISVIWSSSALLLLLLLKFQTFYRYLKGSLLEKNSIRIFLEKLFYLFCW